MQSAEPSVPASLCRPLCRERESIPSSSPFADASPRLHICEILQWKGVRHDEDCAHGSRSPHADTIRQGGKLQIPTIRTCLRSNPVSQPCTQITQHGLQGRPRTGPPCARNQDRIDPMPSIARLNDSTMRDFRSVVERVGVCRSGVMDDSP